MNLKRIISTALTVVMIFTALLAAFPLGASAAYINSESSTGSMIPAGSVEADLTEEQLKIYLENTDKSKGELSESYLNYNFSTAEEMLSYELTKGYLYCTNSADGAYSLYINKYTGFVYYVNNITGQIITSNPINPGYLSKNGAISVQKSLREEIMSQISITFHESANTQLVTTFNSYTDAALRGQISVTAISGGLRVNYSLGDTTARFLLPGNITVERFMEAIFMPMAERYEEMLIEYCSEARPEENFSFFENEDYIPTDDYGYLNTSMLPAREGYVYYLAQTQKIYSKVLSMGSSEYRKLDDLRNDIIQLFQYYVLKAPEKASGTALENMYKDYPITKEGVAIYTFVAGTDDENTKNNLKNYVSKIIKTNCQDYTYAMMYQDEAECLYEDDSTQKPVFRCALEYTLNDDGTLSVRLPANSITYDDTVYTLEKISPLQYFGAGVMDQDGYIFYPDGSGTIVEFDDFYNEANNLKTSLQITSDVYGADNCYSELDGAFREQIIMPVFGLVNEVKANDKTSLATGSAVESVNNGFFAIIEEGSALAYLEYRSKGDAHKFASVYASYTPRPSDEFNLDETNSSTLSLGKLVIVSDTKYSGSYVTRYAMLTDETVGEQIYGKDAYYESSYVGMAAYYRDYLEKSGVLSALEIVSEDLPLYLEVFGAMDIMTRFLTFPVTKSVALTSFDDVQEIYSQLSDCTNYVNSLIEKYQKLADEETDEAQKLKYLNEVDRYEALKGQITDMRNINFRLTGFANGGMSSTYPAKVKWQRSCGGKSGFKSLISAAEDISSKENYNFGVYPDFDFMYINATAAFDGISNRGNVSKMVDNRYASKKVYNSISQEYENFYTLVVSSDVLNKFYNKFFKKYSKYDINTLSVSTLGSDLNSNFDTKDPVNREEAKEDVVALLEKMTSSESKKSYDLMMDKGNIYALKYATHILDVSTDSSHFRYASYTVPFVGLVLHSYVNYTGSPINYSGNPQYDILRSIENGAALYYIVCYKNSAYLKDSETLNEYYGVDYQNWFDSIVTTYNELNNAIGGLQDYKIVDHNVLRAERVIEQDEETENLTRLQDEIIELLEAEIVKVIDDKFDELQEGGSANYGKKIDLTVDRTALLEQFSEILNVEVSELDTGDFRIKLDKVISSYETQYNGDADFEANTVPVTLSSINYQSKYSYITDSFALDKDYVYTRYTVDNGNVTMVTYKKGDSEVKFILNYNLFSVTVKLDAEHEYVIPANGYEKIG